MADIKGSALPVASTPVGFDAIGIQAGASKKLSTALLFVGRSANVMDFGAVGDGVTDDSDAILSAIATGKTISLTGGKTYLVSKPLVLSIGQHFYGNGATIKRAAQTLTTTTSAITSGATNSIVVAAGTGSNFKVGQRIGLDNGANYTSQSSMIGSIVGDTITVTNAFVTFAGAGMSGTTTVGLAFDVLTTAADSVIDGVIFDGNKANWSTFHWETLSEIGWAGSRSKIRGCYFHDVPGEAIIEHGSGADTGKVCAFATVENCNGNGVHLSGSIGTKVSGFRGLNLNLNPSVGHADGGIIASNGVFDAIIDDFWIQNAICGIGSFDSTDNSDLTISNGVIRNCTSSAIEGIFPTGTAANNVVISNVRIYDSISFQLNQTSSGSSLFPTNWLLSNIYMENTLLYMINACKVDLDNVSINNAGDVTNVAVTINNCSDVNYNSGTITGGIWGMDLSGSRIKIGAGVNINLPTTRGITAGLGTDIVLNGPTIYLDATAVAGCTGIVQNGASLAQGCIIRMDHGIGIQQNNNALTISNTIRMTSGTSIKNYGGSAGNIALNNAISQPVSNGGGVSNTFTNNYTIPTL